VFEGGIRVPSCIRWPGKVSAGQSTDAVCGYIDILPTLVSLVGGELADSSGEPIDGVDLSPVLLGNLKSIGRRPWYSYHGQSGPAAECLAVIDDEWKLVVNGPQLKTVEQLQNKAHQVYLFHLSEDLNESTNLAAEYPERVNRLAKQLIDHRALQPHDAIPPYQAEQAGFIPPPLWSLDPAHPDDLVGHHKVGRRSSR
jgi:arylsulfatase A-like enzyme